MELHHPTVLKTGTYFVAGPKLLIYGLFQKGRVLAQDATENSRVCTAMLQDLLERGLRVDASILCVVDGGKGIRKALVDVLGDLAVIQRCQIHKLRNLRSYLPKSRHAYVLQTMKEAYKCKSADKARKRLQALVSWLERNGYDEAAGSLREGMEETLTVVKLALPALLRQSLATTNAIENLNGTIRRVSRNVKRWKSPRPAPDSRPRRAYRHLSYSLLDNDWTHPASDHCRTAAHGGTARPRWCGFRAEIDIRGSSACPFSSAQSVRRQPNLTAMAPPAWAEVIGE